MRYVNLICFGLVLLAPSHILARPRHSLYGFVGGSKMIGHQTNNFSTIEKVKLGQTIKEAHINKQIDQWEQRYLHPSLRDMKQAYSLHDDLFKILNDLLEKLMVNTFVLNPQDFDPAKDELQNISEPVADAVINSTFKLLDHPLSSNLGLIHCGGGYQYPRQDAALEVGYLALNSRNGIEHDLPTHKMLTKVTSIQGFTLIQKAFLFEYAHCRLYAQAGPGILWGHTTVPSFAKDPSHEDRLSIPTTLGVLGGIGFQYPLSSFANLDVAWTHVYVKDYYHFNLCRIALNLHL